MFWSIPELVYACGHECRNNHNSVENNLLKLPEIRNLHKTNVVSVDKHGFAIIFAFVSKAKAGQARENKNPRLHTFD